MIRVVVFLVVVALAALGVAWLADRPGEVSIVWLDHRADTSVMVGFAALALFAVLVIIVWALVRLILRSPRLLAQHRQRRRVARGLHAINHGLIAIGAGDAKAALRHAADAKRLAAHEPLTLLLTAQAAQLAGQPAQAEQTFGIMAARDDTRLLGLHGLFIEAQRRGDTTTARGLAEQATQSAPALGWAARAVLEHRCLAGDWSGALAALDGMMQSALIDKAQYRRQRAVLLTGRARAVSDRDLAKTLALEAVKLAPDLVPAATLAGKFLSDAGETRRAGRVLDAAWKAHPHPDLAAAYIHLKPGDSARERLTRARTLTRQTVEQPEGALALARAAVDAGEFGIARAALNRFLAAPTQRIALLMAEIEEKEHGDVGRAREWMARALRALRDPAWTADGVVSDTWHPVSPLTGRIDAFAWRVPVAQLSAPVVDAAIAAPAATDVATGIEPKLESKLEPKREAEPPSAFAEAKPVERGPAVIPLVLIPDDPGPDHEPV
jgi:HemY protein